MLRALCSRLALLAALLCLSANAFANTLGVAVSTLDNTMYVFDVDTDQVVGTFVCPLTANGGILGEVAITPDQKRAFVSTNRGVVDAIDLTDPTHPVVIAQITVDGTSGSDLGVTHDGRFLVAAGSASVGVIDTASLSVVSMISLPSVTKVARPANDGSVYWSSIFPGMLGRLTLDGSGNLTNTGPTLPLHNFLFEVPMNVWVTPNSNVLLVLVSDFFAPNLFSYLTPNLTLVSSRTTGGFIPGGGALSPSGDRIYPLKSPYIE